MIVKKAAVALLLFATACLSTGLGVGQADASSMMLTSTYNRCSVTPQIPFANSTHTEVAARGVLRCRTREKRRVFVDVVLQIQPTSSPWFFVADVSRVFAKGVPARKSFRMTVSPQQCLPELWRTKTILNVGGRPAPAGQLPHGGITIVRYSKAVKVC